MDKLAQIRDSEVRGVLAAFVDNGLIKVASREDFDALSAVVADNVGYDYDINDIAEVTGAVLNGQVKTAGEYDFDDYQNAIGELYMMKTAGEIDDDQFEEAADTLTKEALFGNRSLFGRAAKSLRRAGKSVRNKVRSIRRRRRIAATKKKIRKALRNNPGKAMIGAGLVGTGLGGAGGYALANR